MKFYASLGNHDAREQRYYKLFNMDGKLYYTFKAPKQSVRFFALESTYLDPTQLEWLEKELRSSNEDWKIPYFHHPLYSSGDRHGSDSSSCARCSSRCSSRTTSASCFTGHDHFYERIKPQKGIVYFVVGSGGQLRRGNIDEGSPLTADGQRHRSELHAGGDQRRRDVRSTRSRAPGRSSTPASITRRK